MRSRSESFVRYVPTIVVPGVTLWIVPSAKDTERLKNIMRPPSSNVPERSYPSFEPHITLVSLPDPPPISLEALYNASVPPDQKPLTIKFKSLGKGEVFYRSVFLDIELSPALVQVHKQVHERLNLDPRTPRYPHLSLCYIDDKDAEERERFHDSLVARTRVDAQDCFWVNCAQDGEDEDWMDGFECTEILAVDCVTGPVESWIVKHRIQLVL